MPAAPQNSRPVKPGLLVALSALFLLVAGVGIVLGPRVLGSQLGIVNVLMLAMFCLFASAVLAGALGAGGLFKTKTRQLHGAAAIFLILLLALVGAAKQLAPNDVVLRVRVMDLPARGRVSIPGGCSADTDQVGIADVHIGNACEADPLHAVVSVAGYKDMAVDIARHDVSPRRAFVIRWVAIPNQSSISGTVYSEPGKLATEGLVTLSGCPSASPAIVDANNGGFVLPIPSACSSKPPFELVVRGSFGSKLLKADSLERVVIGPLSSPPVQPPKPSAESKPACAVSPADWSVVACQGACVAANPDVVKQLRATLGERCGSFCLCRAQ